MSTTLRNLLFGAVAVVASAPLFAADPVKPPPVAAPASASASAPAAAPAPSNPAAIKGIEVHDWVILVCNPFKPTANSPQLVLSSLPENVATRRPSVPETEPLSKVPSPIGMIRFYGEPRSEMDVVLDIKAGEFLGSHPSANRKPQRLFWERLGVTNDPASATPIRPEHWLAAWRGGPALYLTARGGKEQWLLYDAEFQYKSPVTLGAAGPTRYGLVNAGDPSIHDLTIYKPGAEGWQTATLAELPGRKAGAPATPGQGGVFTPAAAPPPSPAKPAAPVTPAAPAAGAAAVVAVPAQGGAGQVTVQVQVNGNVQIAGNGKVTVVGGNGAIIANPAAAGVLSVAAAQAAAEQAPDAAETGKDETGAITRLVRVAPDATKDTVKLLEPWRQRLTEMGFFEQEITEILAELKQHALDEKRLTAVYRLDPAELEKMLTLDVTPTPGKKVRLALVILTGVDPGKKEMIAAWIEQLGDAQWSRREEAEKLLAAEGPGATAQLKEAMKHKDREISMRAERLLDALKAPEPEK